MKVALSADGGERWHNMAELEGTMSGMTFAYPTLAQDGCRLYMAYSLTRRGGKQPVSSSGIKLGWMVLPKNTGSPARGGGNATKAAG